MLLNLTLSIKLKLRGLSSHEGPSKNWVINGNGVQFKHTRKKAKKSVTTDEPAAMKWDQQKNWRDEFDRYIVRFSFKEVAEPGKTCITLAKDAYLALKIGEKIEQ